MLFHTHELRHWANLTADEMMSVQSSRTERLLVSESSVFSLVVPW